MNDGFKLIRFDSAYLPDIMQLYNDMSLRSLWSDSTKVFDEEFFMNSFYAKLRSYYHSFRILIDRACIFQGFIYTHELSKDGKQVFLSAVKHPDCPRGAMVEAVILHMTYLFDKYCFESVRFDVVSYNTHSLSCFDPEFFEIEKRMGGRVIDGISYDTYDFTITNENFKRLKQYVRGHER